MSSRGTLTTREREIARYFARHPDASVVTVAAYFGVDVSTIRTHIHNLAAKLENPDHLAPLDLLRRPRLTGLRMREGGPSHILSDMLGFRKGPDVGVTVTLLERLEWARLELERVVGLFYDAPADPLLTAAVRGRYAELERLRALVASRPRQGFQGHQQARTNERAEVAV